MDKFIRPELDPKKIVLWGPPTTGDELPKDEFGYIDTCGGNVTREKSEKIFELFRSITLDPALKQWRLKQL